MLGLRLTQGLDIAEFVRQTGKSPQALWGSRIDDLERLGMLAQTPAHLRLTRRGMDLHGAVVQRILA